MYLNLLCHFYLHVSWFVQLTSWFDITTGFALKNYPNLTFNMLNSLVCISIYGNFTFMSADLYRWSADLSSLTADLTRPSDLYRRSNPHWCLTCCSLTSTGPKNYQTNWKLRFGQKILTSTTFTLDNIMIFGLISKLQKVILDL